MAVDASRSPSVGDLVDTLQALLGKRVLVVASLDELAFSISFRAQVMGVEASPETPATTLHFGASEALTIPCEGTTCSSGSSERQGHKAHWVELQLPNGPTVMIEELSPRS
jgi:hypothetical protein